MSFLSTLSDFRLVLGVLGCPFSAMFLKKSVFSVKPETCDFDRHFLGFGVFFGSGCPRSDKKPRKTRSVFIVFCNV